jgi:hypothetical protein
VDFASMSRPWPARRRDRAMGGGPGRARGPAAGRRAVSLRAVPVSVLAGPVPGVDQTAARMKADVRMMGPPWELRDGDDTPLFTGQESEVKALYHRMHHATSVLAGDIYVCDPQGARFTWNRPAFRWEPVPAVLPQPRLKTPQLL